MLIFGLALSSLLFCLRDCEAAIWSWGRSVHGYVVSAGVSGQGRGRVAAAYLSASYMLAIFFITISHCPWRDFISLSNGDKETKQRKRLSTICIKCPQRAGHCFWFPRSTVLARATDT